MLHLAFAFAVITSYCTAAPTGLLDQGYQEMYNLQFAAAHRTFAQFERVRPQDPMGPVSDAAAYLFAEFDRLRILRSDFLSNDDAMFHGRRLRADPAIARRFDEDLQRSKELADEALARDPGDTAAMLATVFRVALRADYDALIARQYWKSLGEIKDAQREASALLKRDPGCYDADLAIGFENYLLSFKAAPVRWFLNLAGAETDREKGIAELRLVAEKGHYLKPYAKILLAIAAIRRGDKQEARALLESLARDFPENDLFQTELKRLS